MTARELYRVLADHMSLGQHLDAPVLIRMDGTIMTVTYNFENGVFILIAGTAI